MSPQKSTLIVALCIPLVFLALGGAQLFTGKHSFAGVTAIPLTCTSAYQLTLYDTPSGRPESGYFDTDKGYAFDMPLAATSTTAVRKQAHNIGTSSFETCASATTTYTKVITSADYDTFTATSTTL